MLFQKSKRRNFQSCRKIHKIQIKTIVGGVIHDHPLREKKKIIKNGQKTI